MNYNVLTTYALSAIQGLSLKHEENAERFRKLTQEIEGLRSEIKRITLGRERLKMNPEQANPDTIMQQVSMLNLRINDMMMQLNAVMKAMMDANAALQKENTEFKAKQQDKA